MTNRGQDTIGDGAAGHDEAGHRPDPVAGAGSGSGNRGVPGSSPRPDPACVEQHLPSVRDRLAFYRTLDSYHGSLVEWLRAENERLRADRGELADGLEEVLAEVKRLRCGHADEGCNWPEVACAFFDEAQRCKDQHPECAAAEPPSDELATDAVMARWFSEVFATRFVSDNLPRVGEALYGSRFVLLVEHPDDVAREYRAPGAGLGTAWQRLVESGRPAIRPGAIVDGVAGRGIVGEIQMPPPRDELVDLYVVFDGPPGPACGRFVEVETENGYGAGLLPPVSPNDLPAAAWDVHPGAPGLFRLGPFMVPRSTVSTEDPALAVTPPSDGDLEPMPSTMGDAE